VLKELRKIQGLVEHCAALGLRPKASPAAAVAACEFILEGLHAHRRIGRSQERGYFSEEPPAAKPSRQELPPRQRRSYQ
jgi:magnesium chelatase subunit I